MNFDLFVDTSRKGIAMGLLESQGNDPRYLEIVDEGARGESASAQLESLLAQMNANLEQITRVMVAVGPGSFSGLRTGVAFCEGLCFSGKRKLYGVSTLQALSCFAPNETTAAVIIRARKDYWYLRESADIGATESFIPTEQALLRLKEIKPQALVVDDAVLADEILGSFIETSGAKVVNEKGAPLCRWKILFDKIQPSLTQEANYIQPSYFEKLH